MAGRTTGSEPGATPPAAPLARFTSGLVAALAVPALVLGVGAWGPWRREHDETPDDLVDLGAPPVDTAAALGLANAELHREMEQRRHAEQALEDSETRSRLLVEASPVAIHVSAGGHQRSVSVNPAFTELFGYTVEDVPTVADWWKAAFRDPATREADVAGWQHHVEHALGAGTPRQPLEAVVTCKDGSTRTVQWTFQVVGERCWAFGRDVTDLRRAEAELRESEAKYRVVFDKSPDPFLVLAHGVFVDCNEAAERMLRGDRDLIVGQPPDALSPAVQLDGRTSEEAVRARLAQAIREGDQLFEWVHRRFDGSDVVVEVSMTTLSWAGEPAWFIAWRDVTERKRQHEQLHARATTDALTGIPNRHRFLEVLGEEIRRTQRLRHPLAVAMVDVDGFKDVNDTFGHPTGDRALQHLTRICHSTIRAIDTFARLGGDEFVLLLPETGGEQAYEILERLRRRVEAQPLVLDAARVRLTLSAGVATWLRAQDSAEAFLERADQALYEAKQAGRNRVMLAGGG